MPTHGYIRASTDRQVLSPKVQLEIMQDYCHKNNLGKLLIYQDKETTSKIAIHDREAGGSLMASVRNGDHVLVAKLDRMFRSMRDCVNIVDDFAKRDIHLHCMNLMGAPIDMTKHMGRMFVYMAAMFAELERELICERTRDTLRSLKRAGMVAGNLPYGFQSAHRKDGRGHTIMKLDKEGKSRPRRFLVPCPEERAHGAQIVDLYEGGMDYKEVAATMCSHGLVSKTGKPWTFHAVFRAYHAELALRVTERTPVERGSDTTTGATA